MKKLFILFVSLIQIQVFLFAQAQPNILFIIADDLGIDALEGFGMEVANYASTPNLDALKENGISYLNTWATPQCTPTRASIMSGKYGIKTDVFSVPANLDLEHESIFSYLDRTTDDAYSSAVIGKWHISSPTNADHPFEHGIDHYEGILIGGLQDYYDWQKVENGEFVQVNEYVTTHLTNAAIDWVAEQSKPWFLWLAHIAPHSPFQVPPAGTYTINNPTSNRQKYRASIEALDYEIGRLLDSLDEETRENTLVVFIGDNGTPNSVLSGFPNQHGKGSMYEGGLRVPMIISGSGVDRKGEIENGLTQVNDLHATFIELCSNPLPGGIHNSYSIASSLIQENAIERKYTYADYESNGVSFFAIRTQDYKLIVDDEGNKEFYNISDNLDEMNNLMLNLNPLEASILEELELEAEAIRSGWSCQDYILNGDETIIDDCNVNMTDCDEVDELSFENIGCCDTPDEPSVYLEYEENNVRHIYSNGFPNHDYCYNPNNIPGQSYHYFRVNKTPVVSDEITKIIRDNGRPARLFGVALNGVLFSPAPGTPFIYENKNTGEFNWDWVFEPTNNQGPNMGQVRLDCATAHTNNSGYHYHGEMFEYLETDKPGITSATTVDELYQVGWASDGFPILYKFGPDADGNIKELQPGFQLKSGERPGDGIVAPCGPYTGKYTVDYEWIDGLGDLDECNGIEASVTLETSLGTETFEYYYVVTSSFPQIGRCLRGEVSLDFENSAEPVTGVDMDGDGYLSQFECDDNNASINPSATEIADNGIDEDCDGADLISSLHELASTKVMIFPNPTSELINIVFDGPLNFKIKLYNAQGKLVHTSTNSKQITLDRFISGTYLLEIIDLNTKQKIVDRIVVER